MQFLKKYAVFFSSFSKNLTFITIGSLVVHFIVMIINLYASKTGSLDINKELITIFFSGSMYPVIMAYGILIFFTLTLYQRLSAAEDALSREKREKEKYKKAFHDIQMISGYVLQEVSSGNGDIIAWLNRKKSAGTAPRTVGRASFRIAKALEMLSFSQYVYPYVMESDDNPVVQKSASIEIPEMC